MPAQGDLRKRVKMRELPPEERIKSFSEVALGYEESEARAEAERCLQCKNAPCIKGCPVNINIPAFIREVKNGELQEAYRIITEANLLPGICGRVCPQETQCEAVCVRGIKGEPIAIGRLERFVSDANTEAETEVAAESGHRIAIVGSGPAGLTCAGIARRLGHKVCVYEALHKAGGVLTYGIPEFRMPKAIVEREIAKLENMGVEFRFNAVIGKTFTLAELLQEYDAVFIGTGAGLPKFMGIPGENLNGVFFANEFLTRVNLMQAGREGYDTPLRPVKNAIVVGGGNVAMDAARVARRLGAEVTIVYRRGREEMPARREEVEHAVEEGIEMLLLTNPTKIIGEGGFVKAIECVRMELGEPDASGRRRPVVVAGSEFSLSADTVIIAIGNHPNPLLREETPGLKTDGRGCLIVDERLMTSVPGVFAGGDVVTGAATVILAMEAGKKAAYEIDRYIRNK
ncbi:MAG TPA: NADPH-dependent glutamate synthase [Acholeplasmataceae bacterium]|jgi:glutamate synthase (NADPH/NADH) small chain|nr:NADPH-dependent glutamate synthase [Acholeplasmataceae bacterium]